MQTPKTLTSLIVIRHGKSLRDTDFNQDPSYTDHQKWGRRNDVLLDLQNFQTIVETRKLIELYHIDKKYTPYASKAIRCSDTARYLFQKEPLLVPFEPFHSGRLENIDIEDWRKKNPTYYQQNPFLFPKYGEEGIPQQIQRLQPQFERFFENTKLQNIALTTHGSVITILLHLLNNQRDPKYILNNIPNIPYGGIYALEKYDTWRLYPLSK